MNNIDIANGIIFQEMAIKRDTFDDRLICQKKMYLLQNLGTNLGYTYNWYLRGPYSPSLANYLYNNLDILITTDFTEYHLSPSAQTNVDTVNRLVEKKRPDLSIVSWYELLASLLYIHKNLNSWTDCGEDQDAPVILMKYKPQYNEEHCKYALSTLRENGFIKE